MAHAGHLVSFSDLHLVSSYLLGTAGSLEGQWAAAHGTLFELSEQQIVGKSWRNVSSHSFLIFRLLMGELATG